MNICHYCEHSFDGKFCPNCGKPADLEKFNLNFFFRKFTDVFDLSRGFFYTLFVLFYKPGTAIRKYLNGQTAEFSNPLKLFLLIGAIATWIAVHYQIFDQTNSDTEPIDLLIFDLPNIQGYNTHSGQYFLFTNIVGVPVFSLISWFVYFKESYNYVEHLILNLFIAIAQIAIFLIFSPFLVIIQSEWIMNLFGVFTIGYNLLVILLIFKKYRLIWFLKVFLAVFPSYFIVYYLNYFLYLLTPKAFWLYMDAILG